MLAGIAVAALDKIRHTYNGIVLYTKHFLAVFTQSLGFALHVLFKGVLVFFEV